MLSLALYAWKTVKWQNIHRLSRTNKMPRAGRGAWGTAEDESGSVLKQDKNI
jgi:hypothetical protein